LSKPKDLPFFSVLKTIERGDMRKMARLPEDSVVDYLFKYSFFQNKFKRLQKLLVKFI